MKIIKNHTLEEYNKRYGKCKFNLLKYSQKEVDEFLKEGTIKTKDKKIYNKISLLDDRNWWKIEDTYYEVPKTLSCLWFKSLHKCVKITSCVVLTAGVLAAVFVPGTMHYIKYCTGYKIECKDSSGCEIKCEYAKTSYGDLAIDITPKDEHNYEILGIDYVSISDFKLNEDLDYNYTHLKETKSDEPSNSIRYINRIVIKKNVLDAHKGLIVIKPNVNKVIHVESISGVSDKLTIKQKETITVPVVVAPNNATYPEFVITCDDDILKIDGMTITGVKEGTTTITCTSIDNTNLSCKIEVNVSNK